MSVVAVKKTDEGYQVQIGAKLKVVPLETTEVRVGVRVGPTGTKVWQAIAVIKPRAKVRPGQSELTLDPFCPVNSINRKHTSCRIVDFWEDVSEKMRSRR